MQGEGWSGIVPDFGFAVAPADGEGDAGLVIEGSFEVGAVDVGDGAGAADGGRDLAVAVFDLLTQDVSFAIHLPIRAGLKIDRHARILWKTKQNTRSNQDYRLERTFCQEYEP